jgi:hypothetical protein
MYNWRNWFWNPAEDYWSHLAWGFLIGATLDRIGWPKGNLAGFALLLALGIAWELLPEAFCALLRFFFLRFTIRFFPRLRNVGGLAWGFAIQHLLWRILQ